MFYYARFINLNPNLDRIKVNAYYVRNSVSECTTILIYRHRQTQADTEPVGEVVQRIDKGVSESNNMSKTNPEDEAIFRVCLLGCTLAMPSTEPRKHHSPTVTGDEEG